MIINFTICNYRSFRKNATLSMEAENSYERKDMALFGALSDRNVLPVVGVFGPNASGKSNILRGLFYLKWAICNSDQTNQPITSHPDLQPFLLDGNHAPISFEIELLGHNRLREYTFGFSIHQNKITKEWFEVLDRINKNRRSYTVYERHNRKITFPDANFREQLSKYNDVLSLDEGILTINRLANLVQFRYAKDFLEEIRNILIINDNIPVAADLAKLYADKDLAKQTFNIMRESDLCIKNIKIEEQNIPESLRNEIVHGGEIPNAIREVLLSNPASLRSFLVKTLHNKYYGDGGVCELDFMNNESSGTHRMLFYAQVLAEAINAGRTVVIDELGQGLHPFLSSKIVRTFTDNHINTRGAQLIFDSHELYLLSRAANLYNDQIYLTDKDNQEQSILSSLSEFKERNDAATVKRYLEGRLGGVPNLVDGGFILDD